MKGSGALAPAVISRSPRACGRAKAFHSYVVAHPGRYSATIGAEFTGPEDPPLNASARLLGSIAAVLRGYGLATDEMDHALRTIRSMFHGLLRCRPPTVSSGVQTWTRASNG